MQEEGFQLRNGAVGHKINQFITRYSTAPIILWLPNNDRKLHQQLGIYYK